MKNILMIASEAVPFIKTGGLADVVGALPKYINKSEYDVRVMIPKYLCIKKEVRDTLEYITHFYINCNGRDRYTGVLKKEESGITYYFIDNEEYFAGSTPYGNWDWDIEKFSYFCKAALCAVQVIGFQPDVIHMNDWQTGNIPALLKSEFTGSDFFSKTKTVLTIHNLRFQGIWGDTNMLRSGIENADAITTVSPSYAEEIKTQYYGEGLDGVIRNREKDLYGILNGIDFELFNPKTDTYIAKNYSATDYRSKKYINKKALQKELGLKVDSGKFMVGIVSRLTDQKGWDLVDYLIDEICTDDLQLVVLGTGDARYTDCFGYYANKYPARVSANFCYSEEMAHKIYAASDAFLMPSNFEPCGLSQLIALRYGSLPIVRETGGLRDTVEPYNEYENKGTGFSFANYNAHEMLFTLQYAKRTYYGNKQAWDGLVKRAMSVDNSWEKSAKKYEELYLEISKK